MKSRRLSLRGPTSTAALSSLTHPAPTPAASLAQLGLGVVSGLVASRWPPLLASGTTRARGLAVDSPASRRSWRHYAVKLRIRNCRMRGAFQPGQPPSCWRRGVRPVPGALTHREAGGPPGARSAARIVVAPRCRASCPGFFSAGVLAPIAIAGRRDQYAVARVALRTRACSVHHRRRCRTVVR
jgi:hypothetical protein